MYLKQLIRNSKFSVTQININQLNEFSSNWSVFIKVINFLHIYEFPFISAMNFITMINFHHANEFSSHLWVFIRLIDWWNLITLMSFHHNHQVSLLPQIDDFRFQFITMVAFVQRKTTVMLTRPWRVHENHINPIRSGLFFSCQIRGGGRFRPPLNISPRTTFEVGLNYYPRKV